VRVEIPWYKTAIQGNEEFIVFTLRVFYQNLKWSIDKRFSDCFKLSEELNKKYAGVPEFPMRQPKFLHDPKFLQTRQRELVSYFQSFDQSAFATDEMKNFLNAFTELHKLGYQIRPEKPRLVPHRNSNSINLTVVQIPNDAGYLIPHRMIAIRLSNGNVVLYSMVPLDDALQYELMVLGKVSFIIVPNKLHMNFLKEYMEKFPEAVVYVPPGTLVPVDILDKVKLLQNHTESGWSEEMDQVLTAGNSFFTEVILYHKESKILIVADLLVNLPASVFTPENQVVVTPEATVISITTQLFTMDPADDRPKLSDEHQKYCTDAREFSTFVERIMLIDFDTIVMTFGDIIDRSAKQILKDACNRVLSEVSDRWSLTNSFFFIYWFK